MKRIISTALILGLFLMAIVLAGCNNQTGPSGGSQTNGTGGNEVASAYNPNLPAIMTVDGVTAVVEHNRMNHNPGEHNHQVTIGSEEDEVLEANLLITFDGALNSFKLSSIEWTLEGEYLNPTIEEVLLEADDITADRAVFINEFPWELSPPSFVFTVVGQNGTEAHFTLSWLGSPDGQLVANPFELAPVRSQT